MGSGAGGAGGSCKALRWHPSAAEQLITVSESRLRRWSIHGSSIEVQANTPPGSQYSRAMLGIMRNGNDTCRLGEQAWYCVC